MQRSFRLEARDGCVITADLDFPRLLARPGSTGPGLILLRGGNYSEPKAGIVCGVSRCQSRTRNYQSLSSWSTAKESGDVGFLCELDGACSGWPTEKSYA